MIVQRSVHLNPVEPSPLSLRVPAGIETRLAIFFRDSRGKVTSDLLAQLELAGRSDGRKMYYAMPATDVANGQATAFIPAGDLSDMNGYRLNLYGTVEGQPQLLATGIVAMVAAAGPQAVPPDVIDQIDLTLTYTQPAQIDVTVWQDSGKGTPFDLTAANIAAIVLAERGGTVLLPFTATAVSVNVVRLTLTAAQVDTLPASCWWSLSVSTASGTTTLAEGAVYVVAA
jgi:hypothetical protein